METVDDPFFLWVSRTDYYHRPTHRSSFSVQTDGVVGAMCARLDGTVLWLCKTLTVLRIERPELKGNRGLRPLGGKAMLDVHQTFQNEAGHTI
jgi:hypothetical protein